MKDQIIGCTKCDLHKNQKPILDNLQAVDVMWVGLSAKQIKGDNPRPLDLDTNTGALIHEIEVKLGNVKTYKTNLVKCLPLDANKKLRYPKPVEILACLNNLELEISKTNPKVIVLLGKQVQQTFGKKYNVEFSIQENFNYIPIPFNDRYVLWVEHPSYIHVYKRKEKEKYIVGICDAVNKIICNDKIN